MCRARLVINICCRVGVTNDGRVYDDDDALCHIGRKCTFGGDAFWSAINLMAALKIRLRRERQVRCIGV